MGKYTKVYEPIELAARCPFCNGNRQEILTREYFDKHILKYSDGPVNIKCECGCEMYVKFETDYAKARKEVIRKWNGMFVRGEK